MPRRVVVPRSVTSPQGTYKFADFNSTFLLFQEFITVFSYLHGQHLFSRPFLFLFGAGARIQWENDEMRSLNNHGEFEPQV